MGWDGSGWDGMELLRRDGRDERYERGETGSLVWSFSEVVGPCLAQEIGRKGREAWHMI